MPELSGFDPILVAFGLLPGFVSIQVFALLQPTESAKLRDNVLEAIAYGVFNFIVVSAALSWIELAPVEPLTPSSYALYMAALLIGSMIWPALLHPILIFLAAKGLVLQRNKNAWDEFFRRGRRCWILVHLKDGRKIGGYFGANSYASVFPNSGHIYIETLWKLDESGKFVEKIEGSEGIILRPDDYMMVELFKET